MSTLRSCSFSLRRYAIVAAYIALALFAPFALAQEGPVKTFELADVRLRDGIFAHKNEKENV